MTRVRYAVDEKGMLVDRDGNVLGRLVALTLEAWEGGGLKGGVGSAGGESEVVNPQTEHNEKGRGAGRDSSEIDDIWRHYAEVMQPRRKDPDPAARALIREALKVATAVECKRAIDGCHSSRFHMGENDRGKKYNRLSHILKGKRGTRTTREQIDLFLDIAEKAGVGLDGSSVDPARLSQAKQNVFAAWEFPNSEQAKKAGEMSAAWLAQHGYRVAYEPETGRPTFTMEPRSEAEDR